jgi:hypothetical protein
MSDTENRSAPEAASNQPALASSPDRVTSLTGKLFEPVDNASIVVMRMFFGAIMFREVWRRP